jgi:diadenosine tetraphosphate (Ap4A) HIT family hydrolase
MSVAADLPGNQGALNCELCADTGGNLLWRDGRCRVVHVADPQYPGYCRVIWQAHIKEMTDLGPADQLHCMRVLMAAERALRSEFKPHKINLASFGNQTPHLHWHVIARSENDAHFPNSIWGVQQRPAPASKSKEESDQARERLKAALAALL